MPEFYGWIKGIRQNEMTIQMVRIDIFRRYMREFDKLRTEQEEYEQQLLKKIQKDEKTRRPILLEWLESFPREMYLGSVVTLSCNNSYLVDNAIGLVDHLCKFEVKEGKIVDIKKEVI